MRRPAWILLVPLLVCGCSVRRNPSAQSSPSAPTPPAPEARAAVVAATADSATSVRHCPAGYVCLTGRTGPYTGQPLFVVDGTVYESLGDSLGLRAPIGELRPEEIESIEIVKRAQAVALFGERARDGAIVIRTKRAPTDATGP